MEVNPKGCTPPEPTGHNVLYGNVMVEEKSYFWGAA